MNFYSKEEICTHFHINPNKSEEEIIKELTQIQVALHPDIIGEQTDEEKIKYSQIDDAKRFLRNKDTDIMVPLSDVRDIISLVKNDSTPLALSKEKIEEQIQNTSQKIIQNTKGTWKPAKITATSVSIIVTAIWTFPSVITEHPLLQSARFFDRFYWFLTVIWIFVLISGCFVWMVAYINERRIKILLDILKNEDIQFEIFSNFRHYCHKSKKKAISFTIKDIEKHIKFLIHNNQIKDLYFDKAKNQKVYLLKRYFSDIADIIPEVSQIIITRALEKRVILKEDKHTWYDSYIFNDDI